MPEWVEGATIPLASANCGGSVNPEPTSQTERITFQTFGTYLGQTDIQNTVRYTALLPSDSRISAIDALLGIQSL
jgi:hypothetical protein